METEKHQDISALEEQVKQTTASGVEIQDTVRRLVLQQLSRRRPDVDTLRQLARAVLDGARAGVGRPLHQSANEARLARTRLTEAVAGLDGALAQFAEVTKLALEEAAGQAKAFSTEDLDQASDELGRLETMLVETLMNAAADARDLSGEIFKELAEHFARQGSVFEAELKETLAVVSGAVRGQARSGKQLAEASFDLLRQLTAGVLSGMAERIRPGRGQD